MSHNIIFEDIFDVRVLNENGKKFERGIIFILLTILYNLPKVNRLHCKGLASEADLVVGINNIY